MSLLAHFVGSTFLAVF